MNNKLIGTEKNIIFYNDEEGNTKIEVLLENEDVWLNTEAIASLFNVKRLIITKHINNIYNDNELIEENTCSKLEHVAKNIDRLYVTKYYNLDMIISIGFRVNSKKIFLTKIYTTYWILWIILLNFKEVLLIVITYYLFLQSICSYHLKKSKGFQWKCYLISLNMTLKMKKSLLYLISN
mgnify:CR=1 FL=1